MLVLALVLTMLSPEDSGGRRSVDAARSPLSSNCDVRARFEERGLEVGPAAPPPQRPKPKPIPPNQIGYGDPVAKDARITVHFSAITADGQTIADTETRGMAFTFLMDQETVEPFWHSAVRGLRTGGVRTLTVPASAAGVVIPGDPMISITIKLVRVAPL